MELTLDRFLFKTITTLQQNPQYSISLHSFTKHVLADREDTPRFELKLIITFQRLCIVLALVLVTAAVDYLLELHLGL